MAAYTIKRLAQSVIVLFLISVLAFGVINLAPGDPAAALYGGSMDSLTVEERERINENLGLNEPVVSRYLSWMSQMLRGEMGNSYTEGRSVNQIIAERLPNTLVLFVSALILTIVLSVLLGILAGKKPDSLLDRGLAIFSITLNGIPNFLVAIALVFFFSVTLHWLPSAGAKPLFSSGGILERIPYLILPTVTIMLSHVGSFSRFIQEKIKEEKASYYVMVARANHVDPCFLERGIVKNALVPFLNYAGSHVPAFFSGFVVVETTFAYPGMGSLIVDSIPVKDYPVLMGGIFITGIVVVLSMLAVDLIALLLNPQVRKEVSG